jgi:hypothetical protein
MTKISYKINLGRLQPRNERRMAWACVHVKVGYGGCVAPANSMGSGDGVANSGDGGGGSNGEESEREMEASSGREKGERRSTIFIDERERRGKVGRGRDQWPAVHGGLQWHRFHGE